MKKKIIILIIVICVITTIIIVFQKNIKAVRQTEKNSVYEQVLNRIKDKETFNLLIVKSKQNQKELLTMFKYYKKTYSIDYKMIQANKENKDYQALVNKLNIEYNEQDSMFIIIKDGIMNSSLIGSYSELDLKSLLINSGLLDKKYETIDSLIDNSFFKEKYNKENNYNILYIDQNDPNLYEYRSILVQNSIESLIMLKDNANQIETIEYFNKKLGFNDEIYNKLPLVIRIRKDNFLCTPNITKANIVEVMTK